MSTNAKTHTTPSRDEAIPTTLKALPRWVAWRRETRKGKLTKVPYDAKTGRHASVTDPSTWATFEDAVAARDRDHYDGIGFVLTTDDDIAGVDLDHCRDCVTGIIEPWALAIIDQLHSYTEISPSDTGIRIFVRATLPPVGRKKGPLEFYETERYLTVTGNHLADTPLTIEDRHQILQRVHAVHFPPPSNNGNGDGHQKARPITADDETQLARMFASKNGVKIKRLYEGDHSDYPSQSEADSALCFYLAYWFGRDADRMDRLFRQSGLMRPKWDERHGVNAYGANTIANACEKVRDTYQEPMDLAERLARLRALSPAELSATWHTYLDGLNAVDRQILLKEVARLMNVGINTLKKAASEHQAEAKQTKRTERVGMRLVIPYHPEDVCRVADQIEPAMLAGVIDGECIRFGDSVMRVVVDALPHAHQADSDRPSAPTPHLDLLTRSKLLPLVERAVVLQISTMHGSVAIGVPEKVLDQILINPRLVPKVSALLTHPVVTMAGRIISASGIDPSTSLLLHGPVIEGLRPYSQEEARGAVRELERLFLEGFEFATPLDRAAAVALLVTAVERKLLRECPGFLITAAQQSLGKTTLARLTHCLLTGTDAPVFTWPDEDDVEVQKLLLSTLLRNPAMICFDNVGDGLTFRSPALSSAMTSATKQGRLLGHNRDAVVSTSVLFVLTGNNVELANDEASRIIPARLTTSEVSPHKRTFKHPDVMGHGLEIREAVIRHVIGLVAGYRQSGTSIDAVPSRFPQWDALVRQPLLWVGQEDVGTVFDQNIEASPELGAHKALLTVLLQRYPDEAQFSAADLISYMLKAWVDPLAHTLKEALLALRVKDLESDRSVGHALSRHCGRTVSVPVGEELHVMFLERSVVVGLSRYRVTRRSQ